MSSFCDWEGGVLGDLAVVVCGLAMGHVGDHEPVLLWASVTDFGAEA